MSLFKKLKDFIEKEQMTLHYKPVMLKTIFLNNGRASTRQIAEAFAGEDEELIRHHEKNTVYDEPGKRLKNNLKTKLNIELIHEKPSKDYVLPVFTKLNSSQVRELIAVCDKRLQDYNEKNSKKKKNKISGSLRTQLFREAAYRCMACGGYPAGKTKTGKKVVLEIDHIVPENKGGPTTYENLQVLCSTCNQSKNDRDKTDFRKIQASYADRDKNCVFCTLPPKRIIAKNKLAYAVRDASPVARYHTLLIPRRHIADYAGLYLPERNALHQLLEKCQKEIRAADRSVQAFTIGINDGAAAGQTIGHCHIHLIPRRAGDVPDPTGGVRGVIPARRRPRV